MRPIGYRLNVEVSGIEELKEACKEVSKKAEELQEAIDRLSIIEIELKAKLVNDQTFCSGRQHFFPSRELGLFRNECIQDCFISFFKFFVTRNFFWARQQKFFYG